MSSLKTTHRWAVAQQNPELEKELSAGLGIPGLVARIMVAHGITSIEEGQLFLTPSLDRDWADPLVIPGMVVVADRVERAIRSHERIAVFGGKRFLIEDEGKTSPAANHQSHPVYHKRALQGRRKRAEHAFRTANLLFAR